MSHPFKWVSSVALIEALISIHELFFRSLTIWFNLINECNNWKKYVKKRKRWKMKPNELWTAFNVAMMKWRKGVNFILINYDKWSEKKEFHLLLVMCGVLFFFLRLRERREEKKRKKKEKENERESACTSISFSLIKWTLQHSYTSSGNKQTSTKNHFTCMIPDVINLYCGCSMK